MTEPWQSVEEVPHRGAGGRSGENRVIAVSLCKRQPDGRRESVCRLRRPRMRLIWRKMAATLGADASARAAAAVARPCRTRGVPKPKCLRIGSLPEVEGGGVNQHPFSDLLLPANVDASHPSAHEEMSEGSFQLLTPLAQQLLPPLAPDAAAVGVGGLPRVPVPLPVPAAPVGLAHVVSCHT